MSSGTKEFYTSTYILANLDWSESDINTANNTSKVTVSLWYKRTNTYAYATTDYGNPFYVYISGTKYNVLNYGFVIPGNDNSWHKVGEASKIITHNDDGTKTISIGCSHNTEGSYFNCDNSWNVDLDTIARASVPTASPNPCKLWQGGQTLTVSTNRKSSSFMHTVKVQLGSWSWTSSARAVGASVDVPIPYTVGAQIPATSKTASATVTCTTFNGTTQIGSAQTCSVTIQINTEQDHANVGTITVEDTNARTSAITQDNSIYIANISTLEATIPLTVSGSYTELASAVVTCGNTSQTYTLSGTSQTITFEFDKVNASSLTVKVTDKRGNSVTGTKSWTLIQYQPVTAVATVGRPSATGSVGVGQVTGMAYGGNFGATQNSLSITVDFKKHDDATYTGTETYTMALGQSGYNSYSENFTFNYALDYQYQYDIRFTVNDLFSTATYVAQLMQGMPILSWDETEVDVWGHLHIHDRDNPTSFWDVSAPFFKQYNLTFPAASLMPRQDKVFIINGNGIVFVNVSFMNTTNGTYGTIRCGVDYKAFGDSTWTAFTESRDRLIQQGSGQVGTCLSASTTIVAKTNDMFRIFYYDSNDSAKILRCQIASIGCVVEEERQSLKLATWNVGLFSDGTHRPSSSEAQAQINKFQSAINGIDADIINMQEYTDYVDSSSQYSSASLINYKYGNTLRQGLGKSGSNFPVYDFATITFTSGSGRMCYTYTIYYNGIPITIINAHLSFEVPANERAQDIQQLISYMNTKTHVILTGDFNVYSDSEFNAFTTAGYTLCNGGSFGWFDTWPVWDNMWDGFSTTWPCYHLDNIITSSNIVPQSVSTYTCNISDHAPLVATFTVS